MLVVATPTAGTTTLGTLDLLATAAPLATIVVVIATATPGAVALLLLLGMRATVVGTLLLGRRLDERLAVGNRLHVLDLRLLGDIITRGGGGRRRCGCLVGALLASALGGRCLRGRFGVRLLLGLLRLLSLMIGHIADQLTRTGLLDRRLFGRLGVALDVGALLAHLHLDGLATLARANLAAGVARQRDTVARTPAPTMTLGQVVEQALLVFFGYGVTLLLVREACIFHLF